MTTHHHPEAAMRDAMAAAGVPCGDPLVPDGKLHRFHVDGDRKGSRNGWYAFHLDGVPAGVFGSWKAGISETWAAKDRDAMTQREREEHRRRLDQIRAARNAERDHQHQQAAQRAARIWKEARPADPEHPYLRAKGITPRHARQSGERLVLPLVDFRRKLHSLQFIGPDGTKKLLTGGRKQGRFIPVAGARDPARLLICEGWATGASLADMEPCALVLAAVDAGNLHAVAMAARERYPHAEIVVCCDADPIGVEKGRAAAVAAGALVAVPEFPPGADGSDWNDYAAMMAGGEV